MESAAVARQATSSHVKRVSSRDTVLEWRGREYASEGASEQMVLRNEVRYDLDRRSMLQGVKSGVMPTYICALIEDFNWTLQELKCSAPGGQRQIEAWAVFLHECLTSESRGYHGVAHVFAIAAGATPIQVLAAFFRDIVSSYIDGELRPSQKKLLEGILESDRGCVIASVVDDTRDQLILDIFGHKPGEDLSNCSGLHKGLDIFLSAILSSRLLKDALSLKHILQLAACLEATIPFRKNDPETGKSPLDKLFDRLVQCNQRYELGMSEDELVESVQEAADLFNRSIGNMVTAELGEFLHHTWSLLPEQNIALRHHTLYTVADYYGAICSMYHMLGQIDPETAFRNFRQMPHDDEIREFTERLTRNIELAMLYLRVRMLTAAVMTAFAKLTGGELVPKSFFFGDLHSVHSESEQLGERLIRISDKTPSDCTAVVLQALMESRATEAGFDSHRAPLEYFLYSILGDEGVSQITEEKKLCCFPMTEEGAWALLRNFPEDAVVSVGYEIARMTITRSKGVELVLESLGVNVSCSPCC